MSSNHRSLLVSIGLVSLCMFGSILEPQRAVAQPQGIPDGTIDLMVPQFVADAVRFKAIDESGYDRFGSDEVRAVFSDLNPTILDLVTSKYEDVDTGESFDFKPAERCIAPRPSCTHGVSDFLRFQVSFWEADDPSWPFAQFCYGDLPGLHYHLKHGVCSGDDLIGRGEVMMSREQLIAILPRVGDSVELKLLLGGPCGHTDDICGTGWPAPTGPEYELTYRIRRLEDVRRPLVVAPMQRAAASP